MSSYKVRALAEPVTLGEGPHWSQDQQALYFVDLLSKTIHKYSLETEVHTKTAFDEGANFIIPVEGTDQFVVGAGRRFLVIRWDGEDGSAVEVKQELGEVDESRPGNRINDGKADPRGRLFAGTMDWGKSMETLKPEQGSLYRVTTSGGVSVQRVSDKITIANGLAWGSKEKAFYYIDSLEYKVRRYDYDVETGNISNLTYIFDLRKNNIEGAPDGMTIDTDGNLWIAIFGGSCVIKIDPRTETLLDKISIPAKQVTSVTFGGPNYDILFVTTAGIPVGGEEQLPPCGTTFMVTGLGVKGHPNVNFKL